MKMKKVNSTLTNSFAKVPNACLRTKLEHLTEQIVLNPYWLIDWLYLEWIPLWANVLKIKKIAFMLHTLKSCNKNMRSGWGMSSIGFLFDHFLAQRLGQKFRAPSHSSGGTCVAALASPRVPSSFRCTCDRKSPGKEMSESRSLVPTAASFQTVSWQYHHGNTASSWQYDNYRSRHIAMYFSI